MDILQENIDEKQSDEESIQNDITRVLGNCKIHGRVIYIWSMLMQRMKLKISVFFHKKVRSKDMLSIRAKEIYKEILLACDTDEKLLRIKRLVDGGPVLAKKISGRTIDTLVTRFPRYNNVCYYIDVTERSNTKIIDYPNTSPGQKIILFDIGSSYRQKMHQYSKTYFDCFGRGDEVEHILNSGESVNISLCQFTFFIWADQFKVFEFLESQYDKVINVRQYSQKSTYKPKRKSTRQKTNLLLKRNLKTTILLPPLKHDKIIHGCIKVMQQNRKTRPPHLFKKYMVPTISQYIKQ